MSPASKAPSIVGLEARPGDRRVEVELADLRRARNRAGVDLEIEQAVRRPFAFEVEPGVGRDEMQAAGMAMLESSLNWTSPLSVVWPAKTGRTTPAPGPRAAS